MIVLFLYCSIYSDKQIASHLHTVLEPFLLRRVKSEVYKQNMILCLDKIVKGLMLDFLVTGIA